MYEEDPLIVPLIFKFVTFSVPKAVMVPLESVNPPIPARSFTDATLRTLIGRFPS
jgi:hypothetical protein